MTDAAFGDRVREVLDLALERPAHEREAFVAGQAGPDERLRAEVLSLLNALETGGEALEPPAVRPAPEAESLTGLKFGQYQVADRIGEGGMGVVYRAHDTRLGRAVAVKALPPAVARDPHGRARLEHEARVLASLNHPNIAAIYGIEDTARGPVMVLEFVPGEGLGRRLGRGPMPIDDAVAIAIQLARGLEAAHAAGVVHRDLKPANVQLTAEGGVKVLDFGIAKQHPPGPGDPATHTDPGGVIGTVGYMSPEQARARPVDRRTDLWAFGCVLYEMLSGRRAFEGETASDTVASVLRGDPDWSALPAGTPAAVTRLLRRCLEKDPDRRQRDAGDARLELEAAGEPVAPVGPRPGARGIAWAALGLAAIVIAVAGGMLARRESTIRPPPVRFSIDLPPEAPLAYTPGGTIAVSPDGRMVAYSAGPPARPRLHVRSLDALDAVPLEGTDGAVTPFFSPDGRWVGFVVGEALKRIPVAGGPLETILPSNVIESGCAWGTDGNIVFTARDGTGLHRVPANGGSPQRITSSDHDPNWGTFSHPEIVAEGNAVLCTSSRRESGRVEVSIDAMVADSAEAARRGEFRLRTLVPSAACPRFVPPDRLLYWQAGALMAAPFDPRAVRITGDASVVLKPLAGGEGWPMPRFAVSRAPGVLAWLPGNIVYDLTRLAWFDLDGTATVVTEGSPAIDGPRLSPDGARVAVLIGAMGGDVWVHDLERGNRIRLTTGDFRHHPVWTPDGNRVAWTSTLPGQPVRIEWMNADGTGAAERLLESPNGVILYPTDFTPDGRMLLTYRESDSKPTDVFVFDPRTRAEPERLLPEGPARYGARLSSDGRLIAYTSEETGDTEVYIHEFPSMRSKVRVSTEGGYRPVWSRDGGRLFFRYLNRLSVVDVGAPDGGGTVSLSAPRVLFEHLPDARYEVSADGRRFLMSRPSGDWGPQTRINIAAGWSAGPP